jgi:hypothetical protein
MTRARKRADRPRIPIIGFQNYLETGSATWKTFERWSASGGRRWLFGSASFATSTTL